MLLKFGEHDLTYSIQFICWLHLRFLVLTLAFIYFSTQKLSNHLNHVKDFLSSLFLTFYFFIINNDSKDNNNNIHNDDDEDNDNNDDDDDNNDDDNDKINDNDNGDINYLVGH